MATKRQVETRCRELGVEFDYAPPFSIGIVAPKGYHFAADAYGWHYADFGLGMGDYTRAEIYDCLLECMADGLGKCDDDCECEWNLAEETS